MTATTHSPSLEETWDQLRQNSVASVSKRLGISVGRAKRLMELPLDRSQLTESQLLRLKLISIQKVFDGQLMQEFLDSANAAATDIALVIGLDGQTLDRMLQEKRPMEPYIRGYLRLLMRDPDLLGQLMSGELTVDDIEF